MMYAELSYPFKDTPTPHHFQHIADWQDRDRIIRAQRECAALIRGRRRLAQLQGDVREVIERADTMVRSMVA